MANFIAPAPVSSSNLSNRKSPPRRPQVPRPEERTRRVDNYEAMAIVHDREALLADDSEPGTEIDIMDCVSAYPPGMSEPETFTLVKHELPSMLVIAPLDIDTLSPRSLRTPRNRIPEALLAPAAPAKTRRTSRLAPMAWFATGIAIMIFGVGMTGSTKVGASMSGLNTDETTTAAQQTALETPPKAPVQIKHVAQPVNATPPAVKVATNDKPVAAPVAAPQKPTTKAAPKTPSLSDW